MQARGKGSPVGIQNNDREFNTVKQVKDGEISIERLDDAVKRILTVKQQLGMFEGRVPNQTKYSEVGLQKNREIAKYERAQMKLMNKKQSFMNRP